jgi:hypothetical protein
MAEVVLYEVPLTVCWACLSGEEGECHSPGCAFFICPAPTAEQAERLLSAMANATCVECGHERGQHWQYHHTCQLCQDDGQRCSAFSGGHG